MFPLQRAAIHKTPSMCRVTHDVNQNKRLRPVLSLWKEKTASNCWRFCGHQAV